MKRAVILFCAISAVSVSAQDGDHNWTLNESGGITRVAEAGRAFRDHLEMSGKFISAVVRYGVEEDQSYFISRDIVWPILRTIPNNTHASLIRTFNIDPITLLTIDGWGVRQEKVEDVGLDGKITVHSLLNQDLHLKRVIFPSTDLPVFCEIYEITSNRDRAVALDIPEIHIVMRTAENQGVEGRYVLTVQSVNHGDYRLEPGETVRFSMVISGVKDGEAIPEIDPEQELDKRNAFLKRMAENMILETPDPVLNAMFAFAKIRGAESIYQTRGGPMHGPGGLRYYAAIWANDQAEYINPFFPFLGYDYANESALNSFRHFARFMNPEYRPIPSSIIAEGLDIWHGAGDRGDGAMIAYGAARFALSLGDRSVAEELWPLIEWCLEFCRRKLNEHGVVASDSDELENRFPSGDANLVTSSLYYDALLSAARLDEDLTQGRSAQSYSAQAEELRKNIDNHFGAKVMGYETYRYYDGNDVLRAWICIPLTVGIFDRKDGTIDALFSPELWTEDGLATVSGDGTFWDRATLYGLRGVFAGGDTRRGLQYLKNYSTRRLLGDHVPYAVEAYPEGNQRHLSAESGLYCRIYTEGLFGIRPTSLSGFVLTPLLPEDWDGMKLKNVHGFRNVFDIEIEREKENIRVRIARENAVVLDRLISPGGSVEVRFDSPRSGSGFELDQLAIRPLEPVGKPGKPPSGS
ncbi:MAG: hypothetical protein SCM96_11970 [Acidobacteriota bacterium]|nr:hypothetical protein [Acidobacteriota bacterium]